MEYLMEFIKPELIILVPVIYLIGISLKRTQLISDKYIPLLLGAISIILCVLHVASSHSFGVEVAFASVTQGILVAGASVYCNQILKQYTKDE